MTHAAQLGARAALLLGMLDSPKTAAELYDVVDRARLLDLEAIVEGVLAFRPGAITITVDGILSGGTMEVVRQLDRLEAAGFVEHLGDGDGRLWWRT